MSLILEALRKSEAERRRGQVPGLHAELPPAALSVRSTRAAWPWMAVAIVAVIATAWFARGMWFPPLHAVTTSTDVAGQSSSTAATVAGPTAGNPGAGGSDAATSRPVDDAALAPLDPPRLASTLPSPSPVHMATTAAREPTSMPPPGANGAATPVLGAGAAAASVATTAPPADVAPLPRQPAAHAPALASAVTPSAPIPIRPPAPTGTAAPLRLSDLSAAERLELPPLKMSMHMWGPTPAERFAIIDGSRVNEGDRLGDAVVEEITAGAVVLAWHGRRLQIPLR